MAEFRIRIAGQVAAVSSLFDSTRDYCRCYLTEAPPDFSVTVFPEDLEAEQAALREEALQEGFRVRVFTDPFLDRAVIQKKVARQLFFHDTLLFHGSAVAVDGDGYLFTAKSGTGKSTHTRLWCHTLGSRAVMVNDDKPFLRITPEGILLCGAPWSGKHGLDCNLTVPLKGICILERGRENRISPISAEEALPRLLHESYCPEDSEAPSRLQNLVVSLARRVPLWRMECTREPEAAQIAFAAMSGN